LGERFLHSSGASRREIAMFRPECDPPIPDKETEYSDQIPLSEYLRRRAIS
jgi:hypothetical protein